MAPFIRINMDHVKRIWYLSPMRVAKVQASLRIRAVSPEPSLLAHISSESRGTFRQKARSLAPLNGWACADTNSLDGAHMVFTSFPQSHGLDMAACMSAFVLPHSDQSVSNHVLYVYCFDEL